MGAKRALIVDDSKSARLFLARILEKYEIDVDDVENAEAAIQYLASNRPDVIFMDHLMPGMDGFQAVQAIKNNPLTATIPILMYTSQEGELYLGQARALGAVGVLPKQIKPADVSKVLYQLHLLAERRTSYQTSFRALNLPPQAESQVEPSAANDSGVQPKLLTETALREHFAELRRALVAGVDTQTERITAEVRALLLEALPSAAASQQPPPPPRMSSQWGWIAASIALAIALLSTGLWWQQSIQLSALSRQVGHLLELTAATQARNTGPSLAERPAEAAPVPSGPVSPTSPVAKAPPAETKPLIIGVPYGGEALGGPRLEAIRQVLDRLIKEGHSGIVDIRTFAGRFCLTGNATDGFSVAPDETAFSKCDLIGNPPDESLAAVQRTPLPYANLIAGVRSRSHGALDVQTSTGDASATLVPYPQASNELTAGEWNRAGSANNRIEIRVR